mmetsp:Transcript_38646/g.106448  ORF Transcript_38646/g.106448 Transcript_38646/m.106448 type:complete len:101 (+) Transcript_38646:90-392(+)
MVVADTAPRRLFEVALQLQGAIFIGLCVASAGTTLGLIVNPEKCPNPSQYSLCQVQKDFRVVLCLMVGTLMGVIYAKDTELFLPCSPIVERMKHEAFLLW